MAQTPQKGKLGTSTPSSKLKAAHRAHLTRSERGWIREIEPGDSSLKSFVLWALTADGPIQKEAFAWLRAKGYDALSWEAQRRLRLTPAQCTGFVRLLTSDTTLRKDPEAVPFRVPPGLPDLGAMLNVQKKLDLIAMMLGFAASMAREGWRKGFLS